MRAQFQEASLILIDRHSRHPDQFLNELVTGRPRIAVNELRRVLPLGSVNLLRVVDCGRDSRGELLETIQLLLVVLDVLACTRSDRGIAIEASSDLLEVKQDPVLKARVRPSESQSG